MPLILCSLHAIPAGSDTIAAATTTGEQKCFLFERGPQVVLRRKRGLRSSAPAPTRLLRPLSRSGGRGFSMSIDENKAVVRRFVTEVLTGRNINLVDQLVAPITSTGVCPGSIALASKLRSRA